MLSGVEIVRAAAGDVDGILDLQARNQPSRGGTLSASLPRERIIAMVADLPAIVARRDGRVVGYLLSCSPATNADVPVIRAMLDAYPGAPDAYVYGPICVDEGERGKGLASAMFGELRRRLPGREGVLFIRRDNAASLSAHARMGMREVAGFTHGGAAFAVLAYIG